MSKNYTPMPGSKAELLIHVLRQRQVAMRTPELAEAADVEQNSVTPLLATAVKNGVVTCCKIEVPGKAKAMNEYRIASGMSSLTARPELKPARPTIVPVRPTEGTTIDKPLPTRPLRPAAPQPIFPATSNAAENSQPAVEHNTGSDRGAPTSRPAAVAVAAAQATPAPETKPAMGPARRKAPARDDLAITIDQDGAVTIIYEDEHYIDLTPAQTLALGDFFHATENLWRP